MAGVWFTIYLEKAGLFLLIWCKKWESQRDRESVFFIVPLASLNIIQFWMTQFPPQKSRI